MFVDPFGSATLGVAAIHARLATIEQNDRFVVALGAQGCICLLYTSDAADE